MPSCILSQKCTVTGRHAGIAKLARQHPRAPWQFRNRGHSRSRGCSVRAADSDWHTCHEASATVQKCVQLFSEGHLDGVCEFLPDSVVDRCLERRRNKLVSTPFRDMSFSDLLDLSVQGDFTMDAFAQRGLILTPPAAAHMLSSLQVSEEEFLQRYAITSGSGEEMAITFRMQLEDSLVFARGVHYFKKEWFLRGITGEPASADLPTQPHPQWGPESVVHAQLEAFREHDLASVYRLASPGSQLLSGSYERFVGMMQNAVYRPLSGHREANVMRSVQMARDKTCVVVGVTANLSVVDSSIPQRSVYAWVLRLQDPHREAGDLSNCWLTEGVHPFTSRLYNI